ncbi:MAG: beta-lactamase family protein [Gammaproteobacteria bacterium]|nr:beta-lactamase family protein [Gammaproteobacteria bacterium]
MQLRHTLVLIAALTLTPIVVADDLGEVSPARVDMAAERLARITALSQRYVDEGKLAGVLTMVARGGKIVHYEAVGHRGVDDPRPLTKDALFRIYSMTKPIAAVAAMMLYEEGAFQLSDPVAKFVPELKDLTVWQDGKAVPATKVMTMQHLLTHTAGFSYGFSPDDPVDKLYREAKLFESADLGEFAARLATLPLMFEPGSRWHYSVAVDITGAGGGAHLRRVVRSVPARTPVRSIANERHILLRAGGQTGSVPAEPQLES